MAYQPFVIKEDLSEVQDFGGGQFAPSVPPGDYTLEIVDVEQKTAKSSGNSMITVTFEVVEPAEFAGKRVTNNYALTAAALGRIKRLIMSVGGKTTEINSDDLMGGRCVATIVHNEGKPATNPDGTLKVGADGQPLPPAVFANVTNERPIEAPVQQQSAPPPVARGAAAKGNAQPTRRA